MSHTPPPAPPLRRRTASDAPRLAPLILWQAMEAFMRALFGLFGNPEDVARQHMFARQSHALCAQWIRAGEAMLRRLLLIEAAACAKPQTCARTRGVRKARTRMLCVFEADAPENWRVSFRCLRSSPASRSLRERAFQNGIAKRSLGGGVREADGGGRRDASPLPLTTLGTSPASGGRVSSRFRSAWPLAERYEAMLRVFNDPAPYAQRLARKLYARPESAASVASIPQRPPEIGRDQLEEALPHVNAAVAHFDSS